MKMLLQEQTDAHLEQEALLVRSGIPVNTPPLRVFDAPALSVTRTHPFVTGVVHLMRVTVIIVLSLALWAMISPTTLIQAWKNFARMF